MLRADLVAPLVQGGRLLGSHLPLRTSPLGTYDCPESIIGGYVDQWQHHLCSFETTSWSRASMPQLSAVQLCICGRYRARVVLFASVQRSPRRHLPLPSNHRSTLRYRAGVRGDRISPFLHGIVARHWSAMCMTGYEKGRPRRAPAIDYSDVQRLVVIFLPVRHGYHEP